MRKVPVDQIGVKAVNANTLEITTQQAAPYIEQFLKYSEGKLGWTGLKGQFFPEPDAEFKKFISAELRAYAEQVRLAGVTPE